MYLFFDEEKMLFLFVAELMGVFLISLPEKFSILLCYDLVFAC